MAAAWYSALPVPVAAQNLFPFPGWSHSASVVIGTKAGWAPLPDTAVVFGFPLLVRLDSAYFDFSRAAPDGRDIRFYKRDGRPLFHQVEQWDTSAGKAAMWVKIDTLEGNTLQIIHMQWGNPAAPLVDGGYQVYDTAAGFSGVWHLGETTGTSVREETAHRFSGIKKSPVEPAPVNGVVGLGQLFDGVDDAIDLGLPAGRNFVNGTSAVTVSAWVRIHAFASHNQGILQMSTWSNGEINSNSRANLEIAGGADRFRVFGRAPDEGLSQSLTSAHLPGTDAWYHFAGVIEYGADSMRLYLNGDLDTAAQMPFDSSATDATSTRSAAIGAGDNATYDYFSGIIDEVRVSKTARSADWIRLSYLNQRPIPGLVGFPVSEGCQGRFGVSDTALSLREGQPATVSGIAKCALLARWSALAGNVAMPVASAGLDLELAGIRVQGDTTLHYRFSALFASAADTVWQSRDVFVQVTEALPDPIRKPIARTAPQLVFSIRGRGKVLSVENAGFRKIEIVDLRGSLVDVLPVAPVTVWEGRNRAGRPAAPGLYVVRFRGERVSRQFKVLCP